MKPFKFFNKNNRVDYRSVFVDYTTAYFGKSFTSLRFAERNQTANNPNIKEYRGTFIGFKLMVDNHEVLNWLHNKPVIHLIAFYSDRFNNCRRLGYIDFFSAERFRFKRSEKIKVYYEII